MSALSLTVTVITVAGTVVIGRFEMIKYCEICKCGISESENYYTGLFEGEQFFYCEECGV